jgi:hypothetical protein
MLWHCRQAGPWGRAPDAALSSRPAPSLRTYGRPHHKRVKKRLPAPIVRKEAAPPTSTMTNALMPTGRRHGRHSRAPELTPVRLIGATTAQAAPPRRTPSEAATNVNRVVREPRLEGPNAKSIEAR